MRHKLTLYLVHYICYILYLYDIFYIAWLSLFNTHPRYICAYNMRIQAEIWYISRLKLVWKIRYILKIQNVQSYANCVFIQFNWIPSPVSRFCYIHCLGLILCDKLYVTYRIRTRLLWRWVQLLRLKSCWWNRYDGDFIIVSMLKCLRQNHHVDDKISKLSPTQTVINIESYYPNLGDGHL